MWAGFATTLVAALSYIPIFANYPLTRDFPWVNLLLFLAAGWLLAVGLRRAYTGPGKYLGKIVAVVLGVLSAGIFGLFCYGVFYHARNIPSAERALRAGQQAPEFSLTAADGKPVSLSQLRRDNRAVLLIFYRGYW